MQVSEYGVMNVIASISDLKISFSAWIADEWI